jgi:hypothetical protein
MADSLHSTTPVPAAGGFAGHRPDARGRPPAPRDGQDRPATGAEHSTPRVDREAADVVARRLLRERVLARTRARLAVPSGAVLDFAEDIAGETIEQFVGRLLSAQNLIAARRSGVDHATIRAGLDEAMREGCADAREMLATDDPADAALGVVAAVLVEYGRLLAASRGA